MMEYGDDENTRALRAIDHRKREAPHKDAAAVALNDWEGKRHANSGQQRRFKSIRKLVAQPRHMRLIPSFGLQRFSPGLRTKGNPHQ